MILVLVPQFHSYLHFLPYWAFIVYLQVASAKEDYRSHPDRWSTRVSYQLSNVSEVKLAHVEVKHIDKHQHVAQAFAYKFILRNDSINAFPGLVQLIRRNPRKHALLCTRPLVGNWAP